MKEENLLRVTSWSDLALWNTAVKWRRQDFRIRLEAVAL